MVNPYGRQVYTVDLRREAVDGFVFWTRNIGPFMDALKEVRGGGYPFVVQYGITGYPGAIEHSVIDIAKSIEHVRRIAEEYAPRVAVWRYDTIVFSSLTPREFHLRTFERLASAMEGATDEVVISLTHLYNKTLRNMNAAASQFSFTWNDPPDEQKLRLAAELVQIAKAHRMQLSVCSQRPYIVEGAADARCIDAARLSDVGGKPIDTRLKDNRKECDCYQSRDIGEYDTCPHGCASCYAVGSQATARRRFSEHDPDSEFLFPPAAAS